MKQSKHLEALDLAEKIALLEVKEILLNKIDELIEQNPYKQSGNPDSYSSYNEGWNDALDLIQQEINNLT